MDKTKLNKHFILASSSQRRLELLSQIGVKPDLGEVLDQDAELLPFVQEGIRSRGFKGPLWSEQELRLRHFHYEIDQYINSK